MNVEWLPEAERNFTHQLEWLAERNPRAAVEMGDAILTVVARLPDHPEMARSGRVAGTRELVAVGTPYVVVYRVEASVVLVLRVLHGAQQWPNG